MSTPFSFERPVWMRRADELLGKGIRRVRMLGSVTPLNAPSERMRLCEALKRGELLRPAWEYAPLRDHCDLRDTLRRAADKLDQTASHPLAPLYAERARELALEAEIAMAAGDAALGDLALRRYARRGLSTEAKGLALEWIGASPTTSEDEAETPPLRSDSLDPRSLFSRMREEVGRLGLPFRVQIEPSLLSLAATGDRVIVVAEGRMVAEEDVERTVLHEVLGHARPRWVASEQDLLLFALGTARGTDDQEGYALWLEDRHGHLLSHRKRALAARELAVDTMDDGATFEDTARALTSDFSLRPEEAIGVTERVFRGGDGGQKGLGRERVYIESYLRVTRFLEANPEDEAVLASGQVALDAMDVMRAYVKNRR